MSLTRRRNDLRVNLAPALQQAKNGDFPAGAATALALAPAAEIGLVHFDRTIDDAVGFKFQVVANDLTQTVKIVDRGF